MNLEEYRHVQSTAKNVHENLQYSINPESTEYSIAEKAKELMAELGIFDTWYHEVPAFVLLGSRSCLSISGKNYQPSTEKVGDSNLVTVDLSPMLGNIWGDCARSYFIEEWECKTLPASLEFQQGYSVEQTLHLRMKNFVKPTTLFSELFEFGNQQIHELGYANLDFLNNLGHSIEVTTENRRFIDKNCHEQLGNVQLFTFEPHIKKKGGCWGFKHENIYFFDSKGHIVEL